MVPQKKEADSGPSEGRLSCQTSPHLLSPVRCEAAEVGGSAGRLDPGPRREVPAQEEDLLQEEEDDAAPDEGWRKKLWEEEVAAGVCPRAPSVLSGGPGLVVSLPDSVDPRPLVGLVVNWEETEELVFPGSQRAAHCLPAHKCNSY